MARSSALATAVTLDPNPALRTELAAALALLEPQIRGLEDILHIPPSKDLGAIVAEELRALRRRRDLILATIGALDTVVGARENLVADGYPTVMEVQVPEALFQELKAEVSDVEAAAAMFEAAAANVAIALGTPEDKP